MTASGFGNIKYGLLEGAHDWIGPLDEFSIGILLVHNHDNVAFDAILQAGHLGDRVKGVVEADVANIQGDGAGGPSP